MDLPGTGLFRNVGWLVAAHLIRAPPFTHHACGAFKASLGSRCPGREMPIDILGLYRDNGKENGNYYSTRCLW